MESNNKEGYQKAFKKDDDESLARLLRNMKKFEKLFCDLMVEGTDFNLSLEVHGKGGEMEMCKVKAEGFDRPTKGPKRFPEGPIAKQMA